MKTTTLLAALAIPMMAASARAESEAEKTERMQWFNDARFGMFIHWGVYSEAAGVWQGKPVANIGEWIQSYGKIPAAEYRATLQNRFNPVKYDPDAWVLAAKNAGIKYIVITSKHHDGFCLWDSKLTDWDIASTPYKKDLLRPLADACQKHGLRFCVYHSIMDWSHPDWGTKAPWRGNADNPQPDMDRFTTYLKGQLKELVDDYRPGILWFDGEWEGAWTHERGVDLYDYLRKLDPKLIINNRVDKGRAGMQGHTTDAKFKGDYGTPEQEIPATGFGEGVSWESCMTMNDTWGFKTNDTNWKSPQILIRNLIDIASKGGNYLLNVGPTGAGEIPAASLERLAAVGEWMKINGESIHGTTASLFPKVSWNGRSTTRQAADGSTRLYLHVFAQPADGKLTIKGLVNRPESAAILGQPANLEVSGKEGAWTVQLPSSAANPIATVVALTFKGSPAIREIPIGLDDKGVLKLNASDAKLHGGTIKIENDNIGFWTNAKDSISWKAQLPAGSYKVTVNGALVSGVSKLEVAAADSTLPFEFQSTGSWKTPKSQDAGILKVAGETTEISLKAISKECEGFLNLWSLTLTKQP
jgi:alpha-L-fucosidase